MRTKIYKLPNGKTVVFDYDENGVGKVTVEALDSIMDMLGAKPTGPTVKEANRRILNDIKSGKGLPPI
jgi:hypothetical protein